MHVDHWEHGSDLHLSSEIGVASTPWGPQRHGLWGSGTDVLRALLAWGRSELGWQRCLVPSYYCQEVLRMIAPELPLQVYDAGPGRPPGTALRVGEGDVVLNVALFGNPPLHMPAGVTVIEDHSHDPTGVHACGSRADYAVASLRKTLPLPDGGVLWSPRGLAMPPEVPTTPGHDRYNLRRLSAMALKQVYLDGGLVQHSSFRSLFVNSERGVWDRRPSGISTFSRERLGTLPIDRFRDQKAENLHAFLVALGSLPGITLFDAPFSALLRFDDRDLRDRVRRRLIDRRIYTSVLWPLDTAAVAGIPAEDVAFSERVLSVYVDHRYGPSDMRRVADELRTVVDAEGGPGHGRD
jgi:hypothetical protein